MCIEFPDYLRLLSLLRLQSQGESSYFSSSRECRSSEVLHTTTSWLYGALLYYHYLSLGSLSLWMGSLSLCTKWKSCPLNSSADILHNTHLHASPSAEPRMISSYLSSAIFPNLSSKTVNWLIFALKTYAMSKKRGLQATAVTAAGRLFLH